MLLGLGTCGDKLNKVGGSVPPLNPCFPECQTVAQLEFHGRMFQEESSSGRREKTPTPKTRVSIWTLLRTPGRFTTRPLPVHFTTNHVSVVRPFSVLSRDEIGPHSITGRFLSKAEILGCGGLFPSSNSSGSTRSSHSSVKGELCG